MLSQLESWLGLGRQWSYPIYRFRISQVCNALEAPRVEQEGDRRGMRRMCQ
jgi:hypothetical protein